MSIYDEIVSLDELIKIKRIFEEQQKIHHIGTFERDIQSNTIKWSDEIYRIFDIDLGSPVSYSTVKSYRHPKNREADDNAINKAIDEKTQYGLEYRIIRKNGEARCIRELGKVYADNEGVSRKIFGTIQDITEIKQKEWDQVFKSNILSAVNEAIIAWDTEGVIGYINKKAEDTFCIKAGENIGCYYKKLFKRLNIDFPDQEIRQKLISNGSCVFDVFFEMDEGGKWHEVCCKRIQNVHGDYIGVACAARDITLRKQSQATISRQNMILKHINMIYEHAMSCETTESLGSICLGIIETVTESKLSFIGEIGKDGKARILAGNLVRRDFAAGVRTLNHQMIYDAAVIINDMCSNKLPQGHPEIRTYLSVPYKRGGRMAGIVAVANRVGGYTAEQKTILEALAPSIIEALVSKHAVEDLRDNELLMRTIMDSASDFIFLKDKNSRVVMVNQAYGRIFNVDIKDVIGKNDYELYPDFDLASEIVENDKKVMQTDKTLTFQESAKTAEGYKTYSLSKVPWKDINGDIIGVLGIAHDVTELNNMKNSLQVSVESLKHSKEYIELLYETTSKILSSTTPQKDIESLCDKVMRFLDCDSYFNYLYKEGDAYLKLNACRGVLPDMRKKVESLPVGAAVCGWVLQQGRRIVAENIQQTDDQRTNFLKSIGVRAYACHPLMIDKEVLGTLAFGTSKKDSFSQEELMLMSALAESIALSIKRKQTEEKLCEQAKELELKNKLITDFFINVSHEFKTPLSIIKLADELAENSLKNNQYEKLDTYLGMIQSNSNRLTRLVGNLLDITKVDAGFLSPKRLLVDIVGLLENIVQSIRLYASKRALKVEFISNAHGHLMQTDSGIIERIVLNLLSNAIKHTPKGGKIRVEFHDSGEKVLIAVKDNGEGIPHNKKNIIFDRFRQVNNSLARSNEGCGIGLALSKSLVELLGGRIWLDSVYGEGSSFFVEFPVANANIDQAVMADDENIESSVAIELSDINFN